MGWVLERIFLISKKAKLLFRFLAEVLTRALTFSSLAPQYEPHIEPRPL